MRRVFVWLVLALAATACGDDTSSASPVEPPPPPPAATCAADERAGSDGACELFTSAKCAAGTRPVVGSDTCAAVGPTSCAMGFERDASGWGCAPVLPDAICTGATRPRLGDRACVPVGDCNAAYPPAGAISVDPALADPAIDATHVRTVADALAIAGSGATIALADGMHTADPFTVSKSVTIVGRCAARARLAPSAAPATSGVTIGAKVALRGLTLDGYTVALLVSGATAELVGEDIVIERSRSRAIFAERSGNIMLRRSVVRGTAPIGTSDQTVAVLVGTSAKVALEDSAVLASIDGAVVATDATSTRASLLRTVVQDTKLRADKKGGAALRAFEGAHLDVTESAILGSTGSAVLTIRRNAPPPEVTLTRSVIRGTLATPETGTAIGTAINAAFDAKVRIDESTVSDSVGTALYVAEKARIDFRKSVVVRVVRTPDLSAQGGSAIKEATLALEDSAIVGVGALGLGGWDRGHVTLSRSLVRDIGGDIVENLPMGQGVNANAAATVDATESAIVNARELGASASKAGTTIHLDRVVITREDGSTAGRFGHGILAVDGSAVTISRSIIERQVGVGLFFALGGGVIGGSLVRENAVGAHTQDGSMIVEAESAPDVVPAQDLVVTTDTHFVANATKIGSGILPLPAPIASP